jgi:hypothetical protein
MRDLRELFHKLLANTRPVRLAYQPPASSTFLSEQISYQQPANSTFLSEQTSTSHQPPAKRTGRRLCSCLYKWCICTNYVESHVSDIYDKKVIDF